MWSEHGLAVLRSFGGRPIARLPAICRMPSLVLAAAWNSLEVAKLTVAALVPIIVFTLGWPITRAARRIDQEQWTNRKLIELRLELYAAMAPALNDLLCFFRLVGDFQVITPPEALKRKRMLDKAFYVNQYG